MTLRKAIVRQFQKPTGPIGSLAGWIMANRKSNIRRNLWTVDLLEIKAKDSVLEIECGPGVAVREVLNRIHTGHITAIDHSQTMINQTHARCSEFLNKKKLDLKVGSLQNLNSTDGKYDKIYSVNVVQFWQDQTVEFQKIYSLLNIGGAVATTYMPRSTKPSRNKALQMAIQVADTMKSVGFDEILVKELSLNPTPAVSIIGRRTAVG